MCVFDETEQAQAYVLCHPTRQRMCASSFYITVSQNRKAPSIFFFCAYVVQLSIWEIPYLNENFSYFKDFSFDSQVKTFMSQK